MRRLLMFCCLGIGMLLFGSRSLHAQTTGPVKVGLSETLFPGLSERFLQLAARPFKSLLETQTGVSGQIVGGGQPMTLAEKIATGKVQLGVFQGIEFAQARVKYPTIKPLVLCCRGKNTVQSILVVKANSKAKTIDDLAGKSICYPSNGKTHTFLFLKHCCAPAGKKVSAHYKKVHKMSAPDEAIEAVIEGEVTAAVVDARLYAEYCADNPAGAKALRVLKTSEVFPTAIIAYKSGTLDETVVAKFRAGLVGAQSNAKGKQMLRTLNMTAFEAVPADYEKILTDIAKAYPAAK